MKKKKNTKIQKVLFVWRIIAKSVIAVVCYDIEIVQQRTNVNRKCQRKSLSQTSPGFYVYAVQVF